MASNYVFFSFSIEDLIKEEVEWLIDKSSRGIYYYGEFEPKINGIWIHTEDCADLENLASLLQEFLQKFNKETKLAFEYAYTCSKPRVGEFGGGAFLITKNSIINKTTYEIVEDFLK